MSEYVNAKCPFCEGPLSESRGVTFPHEDEECANWLKGEVEQLRKEIALRSTSQDEWNRQVIDLLAKTKSSRPFSVTLGENLAGTARIFTVMWGEVVIWTHALHIDGPLDLASLESLMRAINQMVQPGVQKALGEGGF